MFGVPMTSWYRWLRYLDKSSVCVLSNYTEICCFPAGHMVEKENRLTFSQTETKGWNLELEKNFTSFQSKTPPSSWAGRSILTDKMSRARVRRKNGFTNKDTRLMYKRPIRCVLKACCLPKSEFLSICFLVFGSVFYWIFHRNFHLLFELSWNFEVSVASIS